MRTVSAAFARTVAAPARPQCGARITIKGYWVDGVIHTTVFTESDIKKIKITKSIDPIGATLPFVRASFSTFYSGTYTAQGEPQAYAGMVNLLAVTIQFVQTLDTGSTETITMPTLFLDGAPTRNGDLLQWSASDVLTNMTNKTVKAYKKSSYLDYVVANTMLDARSVALKSTGKIHVNDDAEGHTNEAFLDAVELSAEAVANADLHETADHIFIFEGRTNDLLKDFLAVQARYMDFTDGGVIAIKKPYDDFADSGKTITYAQMLKEPRVTVKSAVSSYTYTQNNYYIAMPIKEAIGDITMDSSAREIESEEMLQFPYERQTEEWPYVDRYNIAVYHFIYPTAGVLISRFYGETVDFSYDHRYDNFFAKLPNYKRVYYQTAGEAFIPWDISAEFDTLDKRIPRYFLPYLNENKTRKIEFGGIGENYEDENSFAVYGETEQKVVRRYNLLRSLMSRKRTVEFQIHADLSLDTGDVVSVQTTRSGDYAAAVIVETEITYDGKLTEKMEAMEI